MDESCVDALIIGSGAVGSAIARELSRFNASVCVVDCALDVAGATSRANSGIAHAGFDATAGSLKAHFNVLGSRMMPSLAKELGFSYVNNGSLVLAFTEEEQASLQALLKNGIANGVEDLRIIDAQELHQMEPLISTEALEALWAPTGAIINPYEMTLALAQNAAANGVEFLLGHKVIAIQRLDHTNIDKVTNTATITNEATDSAISADTDASKETSASDNPCSNAKKATFCVTLRNLVTNEDITVNASCIVNAAGIHSSQVAAMAGAVVPAITPRRGEYVILDKRAGRAEANEQTASSLHTSNKTADSVVVNNTTASTTIERCAIKHTIFRAPSAVGKGVLVSPTVDGNIIVGPNAHAVDATVTGGALDTTHEGIQEVLSKAQGLWPHLPKDQVITRFAGLRATPDGGDFVIGEATDCPFFFNAVGIESPGLTAAPAIGVELAAQVAEKLGATKRADFCGTRQKPASFTEMTEEERARAIATNPEWGHVVCRCEQVTEAEIRAAVRGENAHRELGKAGTLPATTLDAVKWRTRAGMGRCHGGFCSPHVARIIAEETGCSICDVLKRDAGSHIGCFEGDLKTGALHTTEQNSDTIFTSDKAAPSADSLLFAHKSTAGIPEEAVQPALHYADIAIVGGGAAGIAAALSAVEAGVSAEQIILIDREQALGGILKQCIHPGFGLERYREELTGPEYAARDIADLHASGVRVLQNTTVCAMNRTTSDSISKEAATLQADVAANIDESKSAMTYPYELHLTGPQGASRVQARAIILATGSRERSVGQLDIDGHRPAGVYSAGSAQNFMNLMGTLVGREVVLFGSGDIGLIMARRLAWEGAQVKACVVRGTRPSGLRRNVKQCLEDNDIPILLSHSVTRVIGDGARVCGVEICETDKETKEPIPGTERILSCDTLLISCGLIPEQDLLTDAGGAAASRGSYETTWPGVFLCGNAAAIHDVVDHVTQQGSLIGRLAAEWILNNGQPCKDATSDTSNNKAEGDVASKKAASKRKKTKKAKSADPLTIPEGAEEMTCICCPIGCTIYAALDDTSKSGVVVVGNNCKRGAAYAAEELTAPRRTLTTIVRCAHQLEPISVRTDDTILKTDIPACLEVLRNTCIDKPVAIGDVIVENICDTGVNIIATKATCE